MNNGLTLHEPGKGDIIFTTNNDETTPILELKANGDILVKGNPIANDIEVYEALKEFVKQVALKE